MYARRLRFCRRAQRKTTCFARRVKQTPRPIWTIGPTHGDYSHQSNADPSSDANRRGTCEANAQGRGRVAQAASRATAPRTHSLAARPKRLPCTRIKSKAAWRPLSCTRCFVNAAATSGSATGRGTTHEPNRNANRRTAPRWASTKSRMCSGTGSPSISHRV
jgi:hypothetical protein